MASASSTTGRISGEVRDDNPYSRLMALQKMGVVTDYERILDKTVAVVGVGGVGSVVCEMLTRCGVGKLILFDYDKVELANMNRLFYQRHQCGKSKVEASAETLSAINPDVEVECHNYDVTTVENFEHMVTRFREGGKASAKVDLVLSCVDNFEARLAVNQACLEADQVWMESGVAENAVSGHIQLLIPGFTPCYQCIPPLVVATGAKQPKREGVCAASLPTTMGVIAGFLAQNALKYLLRFGEVSAYVGYDAMSDHFPSVALKPNLECTNAVCIRRQAECKDKPPPVLNYLEKEESRPRVEDANEWGIVVEDSNADDTAVQAGSKVEYEFLRSEEVGGDASPDEYVATEGASLEDLAAKLRAMG